MGAYNRKDLCVSVLTDGSIYVTQGNPSFEALQKVGQIADCTEDLFFSQLFHRVVCREENGDLYIDTPTNAKKRGFSSYCRVFPHNLGKCTGKPYFVGKV